MLLQTFPFLILLLSVKVMSNHVVHNQDLSLTDNRLPAIQDFTHLKFSALHSDASLTTLQLVSKYGYNGQLHKVTTSDGYILELHRITGRANSSDSQVQKPVVLVMHGILSSSAVWVLAGPEKGLGYLLADAGYDVWLGNARGSTYSRKHVSLSVLDQKYWDFSWHETGIYDLPAMIDYILNTTNQEKLFYLGHSQGTTNFFVMASERPEYQNKIQATFAMAPVAYIGKLSSLVLRYIAKIRYWSMKAPFDVLDKLSKLFGIYEFRPNKEGMKILQKLVCTENVITQPICRNLLFLIAGFDKEQFNNTLLPIVLGHVPAGASIKQLNHYVQLVNTGSWITSEKFRQYDYGAIGNKNKYNSFTPPSYNLKKIRIPVILYYSSNDWIVNVKDVDKLAAEIGSCYKFLIPYDKFNHLDFVWAKDVKSLLYDNILNLMARFRKCTCDCKVKLCKRHILSRD